MVSVITIYPIVYGIYLSFAEYSGSVGLENYNYVFSTYGVTYAIINTLLIVGVALTIQFLLALLTALLLNRDFRGRSFFRTVIMVPFGVATVVSGIAFTFIFSPSGWYLNSLLIHLGLISTGIDWIRPIPVAIMSVALADSWKNFPLIMLILLGGLSSIPQSQYESAAIDGAGFVKQFIYITLPGLFPFIMIAVTIRLIQEVNILSLPLVLTGYTPAFLGTLSFQIYETFSLGSANQAAAVATILLGIVVLLVTMYIIISRRMGMEG